MSRGPNLDLNFDIAVGHGAEDEGSKAPLLNDYKVPFVRRRLFQTLLGGVRSSSEGLPWFVWVLQLVVWLVPWLVAALFTALREGDNAISEVAAGVGGGAVAVAVAILLRLLSYRARWQAQEGGVDGQPAAEPQGLQLGDEDVVDFDGWLSPTTVLFVLPIKRVRDAVLQTLLVGPLVGGAIVYLLPSRLEVYFSETGAGVVHTLSWVAVCVATYPLLAAAPPEPNTFRRDWRLFDLQALSRSVHVAVFLALYAATHANPEYKDMNEYLHLLFLFLPVLWLSGVLPPLDAFVSWGAEQLLVHAFGGTHAASDARLTAHTVLAVLHFGVTWVLLEEASIEAALAWAGAVGFLLSLDAPRLLASAASCGSGTRKRPSKAKVTPLEVVAVLPNSPSPTANSSNGGTNVSSSIMGSSRSYSWLSAAWYLVAAAASALTAALVYRNHNDAESSGAGTPPDETVFAAAFATWALLLMLKNTQHVYLFGAIRNPLYPPSALVSSFASGKTLIDNCGLLHRTLRKLLPLLAVGYFSYALTAGSSPMWLVALGIARACRWSWQSPSYALLHLGITGAVRHAVEDTSGWHNMSFGLQLLVIAFVHDRVVDLGNKLVFVSKLVWSSWFVKPMRTKWTGWILVVSILLLPIPAAIILLSVALAAPLLPLFGLPLFFVSFPRPKRMWPGPVQNQSQSEDAMYYQQAIPSISNHLSRAVGAGKLGAVAPGAQFLSRFENRMLWLSVTEVGHDYARLVAKGLELQETSCHTVEASAVEDAFTYALARDESKSGWNKYLGSVLLPQDATAITSYSDTKNVLTGLIDAPDMLDTIGKLFLHSLVWLLHNHAKNGEIPRVWRAAPFNETHPSVKRSELRFPEEWYEYCKQVMPLRPGKETTAWESDVLGNLAGELSGGGGGASSGAAARSDDLEDDIDDILETPKAGRKRRPSKPAPPAVQHHQNALVTVVFSAYLATMGELGHRLTPGQVCSIFSGQQTPAEADWNTAALRGLTLKAFRFAVKLALDVAISGFYDLPEHAELHDELVELQTSWFVGPDNSVAWSNAVKDNKQALLSISLDQQGRGAGVVQSHMLRNLSVPAYIGRLDEACIAGSWASLHYELLYLTNDDDERYSIQAHKQLLRNLTVQAADPPLGYPIFTTELTVAI